MSATSLIVHTEEPLNAEPDLKSLGQHFLTPTSLIFKRNHSPLRSLPKTHSVSLSWSKDLLERLPAEVRSNAADSTFTAADLDSKEQLELTAVLQCAGNRRDEMSARGRKTEGLGWGSAVAANLRWKGVSLRLLLRERGIDATLADSHDIHVEFISEGECEEDSCYASSVALADAMDEEHPILLATRMNGEPIPDEHGGPIRAVVPNQIGARSVKWLDRIVLRIGPSQNFYMQSDYKVLPPDVGPDEKEAAMTKVEALRQYSHQSVITEPADDSSVTGSATAGIQVRGYAIRASRVEVIALDATRYGTKEEAQDAADASDCSQWTDAELQSGQEDDERDAWQLWRAEVDVRDLETVHIVCRAYDEQGRPQPKVSPFNLRGVDNCELFVAQNIRVERAQ